MIEEIVLYLVFPWMFICLFLNLYPYAIAKFNCWWKLYWWTVLTTPLLACIVAWNIRDRLNKKEK